MAASSSPAGQINQPGLHGGERDPPVDAGHTPARQGYGANGEGDKQDRGAGLRPFRVMKIPRREL